MMRVRPESVIEVGGPSVSAEVMLALTWVLVVGFACRRRPSRRWIRRFALRCDRRSPLLPAPASPRDHAGMSHLREDAARSLVLHLRRPPQSHLQRLFGVALSWTQGMVSRARRSLHTDAGGDDWADRGHDPVAN